REIDAKFTGIEQAVNLAIAAKRADLKRAVQDAQAHGIEEKELALEGAKSRCNDIAGRIQTFANDCGLAAPTLPEYQAIENLDQFFIAAKQVVRKLRNAQPDLKRQAGLLRRKEKELNPAKAAYEGRLGELNSARQSLADFKKMHGEESAVQTRLT